MPTSDASSASVASEVTEMARDLRRGCTDASEWAFDRSDLPSSRDVCTDKASCVSGRRVPESDDIRQHCSSSLALREGRLWVEDAEEVFVLP